MNATRLTTPMMLHLSDGLLHAQRSLFLSIDVIAPLYDRMRDAHEGLKSCAQLQAQQTQVHAYTRELAALNRKFDGGLRAYNHLIAGHIQWQHSLGLEQEAPGIEDDLDNLKLPQGLSAINQAYESKAGLGLTLEEFLSAKTAARLQRITGFGVTALDIVQQLIAIAARMGERLRQRTTLEAAIAQADSRGPRRQWIKVVNLIETIAHSCALPPAKIGLLLRPFWTAVANQAARKKASTSNPQPQSSEETAAKPSPLSPANKAQPSEAARAISRLFLAPVPEQNAAPEQPGHGAHQDQLAPTQRGMPGQKRRKPGAFTTGANSPIHPIPALIWPCHVQIPLQGDRQQAKPEKSPPRTQSEQREAAALCLSLMHNPADGDEADGPYTH